MQPLRYPMGRKKVTEPPCCCVVPSLPAHLLVEAAMTAIAENPLNRPAGMHKPEHLAVLTTKQWSATGVDLTVGFMEAVASDLRDRIIAHANAWGQFSNVKFRWTQTSPQVRISLGSGGYYSYLGTDILHIPQNELTMNLEGFTMNSPESEFVRVVRHEFGHTLGFPHEQQRPEILALLDARKTIAFFAQNQGWDEQTVRDQILTPLDPGSYTGSALTDQKSIMCYSFPGSITRSGQAILGGDVISATDRAFAASVYPQANQPPPPPPPPPQSGHLFYLDFPRARPKGDRVSFVLPIAIAKGKVDVQSMKNSSADVEALFATFQSENLPTLMDIRSGQPLRAVNQVAVRMFLLRMLHIFRASAVPLVEMYMNSLSLSPELKAELQAAIALILGLIPDSTPGAVAE